MTNRRQRARRDGGAEPPPLEPAAPVIALRGVGPVRAAELVAAGYTTVGELLRHLPVRYEDRRTLTPLAAIDAPGTYSVRGRLCGLRRVRIRRRRLSLVRGRLEADGGSLEVVWFNRPYLASQIDPQAEYLLHGAVREGRGEGWQLVNPSCEPDPTSAAGVVPIYRPLAGLGPAALRRLFEDLFARLDVAAAIRDPLPAKILARHGLPRLGESLALLHQPDEAVDVEELSQRRSPAHCRLIYGELLDLQLHLAIAREQVRRQAKRHEIRLTPEMASRLLELVPFELTGAQERVLEEIVDDLRRPEPMLRLLQGDVGSGKTIVALLALVVAVENGLQGAFMAPTELLAEQHYRSFSRLLGDRYRLALVTASAASGRGEIASGEVQIAVGTHALIQRRVEFARLGLTVIDEQHRFGVAQRQLLQAKGESPDLLVMTATPIPRSLTLALYGDLDLSVIDELPPGRQPAETRVLAERERPRVHRWLRARLAEGAQAYVVLPLIDDSDRLTAASIATLGKRLREDLAEFSPEILHGRTSPDEREAIMRRFSSGEAGVLIATTIIEVGLHVARASVMVIENAERFGLAQLHQLRGRIGRGGQRSHCLALHGKLTEEAERRLRVFAGTSDGFEIAEADLDIRGPGDLLGTRQAGLPALSLADLVADREWLERARRDARDLLPVLGGDGLERLGATRTSRAKSLVGG